MYYSVIWRAQRDERFVCVPELFHIIWFWGGGYAVSQSVLHHSLLLKAHLQHIIVSFEGPKETRGAHALVPDIFHIIWFWRVLLYLSQFSTVFYHWMLIYNVFQCSLKGQKRRGVCMSAFWSYSTLFGFGGEIMLYLSQFSTVFYCWRLVYNVFRCSSKGPKRWEVCVSTFQSYSTLFGFGRVMLYLGQFSTIFYHWRLVFNVF